MSTLIWIEHDEFNIHPATSNLIVAATQLAQPVHALVIGANVAKVADEVAQIGGVTKVITCEASYYFPFRPEPLAQLIAATLTHYQSLVALSTTTGKNIVPRVAGLCKQPMLSDVIKILSPTTFVRPIYAGNAISEQSFNNCKAIITIRPTAFEKQNSKQPHCSIEKIEPLPDDKRTEVLTVAKRANKTDLQSARIVVSGGRALGSKENFQIINEFAELIGAAVGASRAAVDAGFIANDYQVGQTGKIVAPEVYFALGISGAIQHVAGMKDSKVIVAINKDIDAPIFEIATYGLVGDIFTILPQITAAITHK